MHPVSKSTKKAYRWGNGGIGWPLVETKGLLVVEETLAPGCSENIIITIKQCNVSSCWRGAR